MNRISRGVAQATSYSYGEQVGDIHAPDVCRTERMDNPSCPGLLLQLEDRTRLIGVLEIKSGKGLARQHQAQG